ncbi:hypothetical protein HYFRA_00011336 [Hymenoscyphus fraxineus]|uniref:Uncharacterized protein n=1 Tax=Hymenoscyphus fraxineus TaxID=746836 RepID=A0A9N9L0H4_9HELO|nr:hypothetical protein HYFRA_00011336 [Hymenoscyphus fraxineus]
MTSILGAPFNAGSSAPMTPADARTLLNQLEENITYVVDTHSKSLDDAAAHAKYEDTLLEISFRYTQLQDDLKDHNEFTSFMEKRGKDIDAVEKNKFCKSFLDSQVLKFEIQSLFKDIEMDRLKVELVVAKEAKTSAEKMLEEYRDDVSKLMVPRPFSLMQAKVTAPIGTIPAFKAEEASTPALKTENINSVARQTRAVIGVKRRAPQPAPKASVLKPLSTKVVKNAKNKKTVCSKSIKKHNQVTGSSTSEIHAIMGSNPSDDDDVDDDTELSSCDEFSS